MDLDALVFSLSSWAWISSSSTFENNTHWGRGLFGGTNSVCNKSSHLDLEEAQNLFEFLPFLVKGRWQLPKQRQFAGHCTWWFHAIWMVFAVSGLFIGKIFIPSAQFLTKLTGFMKAIALHRKAICLKVDNSAMLFIDLRICFGSGTTPS